MYEPSPPLSPTSQSLCDGVLRRLPRVRHLLACLLIGLVVGGLPLVWAPASAVAQGQIYAGPSGTFGSTFVFEVYRHPELRDPCGDVARAMLASMFAVTGGGDVSVTCGADEAVVRYVALVQGPRCVVAWDVIILERRPCLMLPMIR